MPGFHQFFVVLSLEGVRINDTKDQLQNLDKSSILRQTLIEGNCGCNPTPFSYCSCCQLTESASYSFQICSALFQVLFSQDSHLQPQPQPTPALQHSQQRFKQCDFLQLQRFYERGQFLLPPSLTPALALVMTSSNPGAFWQLVQPQSSPHCFPWEKHSQYILRQKVFLQVQPILRFLAEFAAVWTWEMRSRRESSSLSQRRE